MGSLIEDEGELQDPRKRTWLKQLSMRMDGSKTTSVANSDELVVSISSNGSRLDESQSSDQDTKVQTTKRWLPSLSRVLSVMGPALESMNAMSSAGARPTESQPDPQAVSSLMMPV